MKRKRSLPVVFQGLKAGLRMFRWVVVLLLILFFFSGLETVRPGHKGLLLRFGRLQGASPADKVKDEGLALALPYPIDNVLQVPTDLEVEVVIEEVWKSLEASTDVESIDPTVEGYCVTGDQNILQPKVVVRYRIKNDPEALIRHKLWMAKPEEMLHDIVLAALTRTMAEWIVDDARRMQREIPRNPPESTDASGMPGLEPGLIADAVAPSAGPSSVESLAEVVRQRAQKKLDELEKKTDPETGTETFIASGIWITAIQFKEMHPPRHVIAEFRAVRSAEIDTETRKREAEGFALAELHKAEADRNGLVEDARAFRESLIAQAQADFTVFKQLHQEYVKNPGQVWDRVFHDTWGEIFEGGAKIIYVSPDEQIVLPVEED